MQVEELELWDEGIGAVEMISLVISNSLKVKNHHDVYVNLKDTEKFTDKRNGNV